MADTDRATCRRCGAPIWSDDPAALCPACLPFETRGGRGEDHPVSSSAPGNARPWRMPSWAPAVVVIGAIFFGYLWSGGRRGRHPAEAVDHYDRGMRCSFGCLGPGRGRRTATWRVSAVPTPWLSSQNPSAAFGRHSGQMSRRL
jgi:hypothetical protein